MYIYKCQLDANTNLTPVCNCAFLRLCTCVLLTCCLRQQQECFFWVVCSSLCCRGMWCNSILFLPPFSLSPSTLNNPTLSLSLSLSLLTLFSSSSSIPPRWPTFTLLACFHKPLHNTKQLLQLKDVLGEKKEGIREKEQAILMTGMREERKEIGGGWSANYKTLRFSRECHLVRVGWWLVWIAEVKTHQSVKLLKTAGHSVVSCLHPSSIFVKLTCKHYVLWMQRICVIKLHNVNHLEAENMFMRYLLGFLPSLLTFSDQSCSLLRFSSNLGVPFTLQHLSIWKVLLLVMALM